MFLRLRSLRPLFAALPLVIACGPATPSGDPDAGVAPGEPNPAYFGLADGKCLLFTGDYSILVQENKVAISGKMFVMGGAVSGGQVMSLWPGLAAGQLYQNQDLQVTIDYRDILAEIVSRRLNNAQLDVVFPGYSPTFRNAVV